jgi:UDP-2,3-diacylglucosamine hydrolase
LTTLFISDLHLQPSHPELLRACLRFLETTARGSEALYILGDLFEAWIGDDDDTPWLEELATALRALADAGTRLNFLHGNRDFLLGAAFARRCGMELLPEAVVVDLYGRKALLLHGDTLCTADVDYLKFRAQVRDPQWQQMILGQSLDNRRALAGALRVESKLAGGNKSMAIMDVTPEEVVRVLESENIDLMIHGCWGIGGSSKVVGICGRKAMARSSWSSFLWRSIDPHTINFLCITFLLWTPAGA